MICKHLEEKSNWAFPFLLSSSSTKPLRGHNPTCQEDEKQPFCNLVLCWSGLNEHLRFSYFKWFNRNK